MFFWHCTCQSLDIHILLLFGGFGLKSGMNGVAPNPLIKRKEGQKQWISVAFSRIRQEDQQLSLAFPRVRHPPAPSPFAAHPGHTRQHVHPRRWHTPQRRSRSGTARDGSRRPPSALAPPRHVVSPTARGFWNVFQTPTGGLEDAKQVAT